MNFEDFNSVVLEHRNSIILIACLIVGVGLLAMFFLAAYVGGYFKIGKIRFPSALLLLIPILFAIICSSIEVINCNKDIMHSAYEVYVGNCIYESETVTLEELDLKIHVGLHHTIVPYGDNYGKCIYSKYSKVIVYWESIEE